MQKTFQRLPMRVLFRGEEPAYGLLGRLALRFGRKSTADFASSYGLDFEDVLRGSEAAHVATLAGFSPKALAASTVRMFAERAECRGHTFDRSEWLPKDRGRVCPRCLLSDLQDSSAPVPQRAFRRFWWDWSSIDACPRHAVRLLDACPNCNRPLSIDASDIRRCKCGADLSRAPNTVVDPSLIRMEKYLLGRLMDMPHRQIPVLDAMPLASATTAVVNVGWHLVGHDKRLTRRREDASPTFRLDAKKVAYAGLRRWPRAFREVLDRLRRRSELRRIPNARMRTGAYDGLYEWLDQNDDPAFDELRNELKRHFLAFAPVDKQTRVFGELASESVFVSLGYANAECGFRTRSKELFPWLHHLNLIDDGKCNFDSLRIPRRLLPELKRFAADAIMFKEAMKILGIGIRPMEALVAADRLYDLSTPYDGKKRLVLKSQVQDLWRALAGAHPAVFDKPPPGAVTVFTTTHHKEFGGDVASIVGGILREKIRSVGVLAGRVGLRSLLVDRNDVRALIARERPKRTLNYKEAAALLQVKREAIDGLFKIGLEGTRSQAGKVGSITIQAIEAFSSKFISRRAAAAMAGLNSGAIVHRLRKHNIEPHPQAPVVYLRTPKLLALLREFGAGKSRATSAGLGRITPPKAAGPAC